MEAQQLALALSDWFLLNGAYTNLGGGTTYGAAPAATDSAIAVADMGFAGLAVQAVGYADGGKSDAVHIYLTKGSKKLAKSVVPEVDGIKIEVHHMGRVSVRPEAAAGATHNGLLFIRNGRIACGSSCAPSGEQYSGTLGAFVSDASGALFALSNNHVFAACNHTPVGQPIMAPSGPDARPSLPAPIAVARHASIVELRSGEPALVSPIEIDAAIAQVGNVDAVTSWQGDPATGYDTPGSVGLPAAGVRVKKFGRTTGLTRGVLHSRVPKLMPLPYKTRNFSAVVYFQGPWIVMADGDGQFALPGDSGSLVVSEDGSAAVGLLFAASPNGRFGFIVPISRVLESFQGLQLVAGLNT